jgi:hypothetical protein
VLSAQPALGLGYFIASRLRSRIRLELDSATIANKLNSSRSTGSVGSWIEPPRLSFTLHLVSSSRMSRASGSEPCDAPQAGGQPALGVVSPMNFPRRVGLYAEYRLTGG